MLWVVSLETVRQRVLSVEFIDQVGLHPLFCMREKQFHHSPIRAETRSGHCQEAAQLLVIERMMVRFLRNFDKNLSAFQEALCPLSLGLP